MKLFLDSADISQIETVAAWGCLDGLTTNPSLAAKQDQPYPQLVEQILERVNGPVSLEVIATDYQGMLDQARRLHELAENVVVKIPCTKEGLRAVSTLREEGIDTNVTLVFSPVQALLAAKAGARFCSPFIGRVEDIADDAGFELIARIREIYDNYDFETEILAASIRHVDHVEMSALLGADIATIPFDVFENLTKHKLTDTGLQQFLDDWDEAGLELPA